MSQFLVYSHILGLDLNLSMFHTSLTCCYLLYLIPYYYVKLFLLGMLNCVTEVRDNVACTREMNPRLF